MRSKKIGLTLLVPALIALALPCGCGGQRGKGSPNDPNEQQGNPNAKPEQSVTPKPGSQPRDDQSGKDPHAQLPDKTKGQ